MSFTIIITIATVLISIAAFNNEPLYSKLILWPRVMDNPAEYYRLLTSGFIHENWVHLFLNMFALYSFGQAVEMVFMELHTSNTLYLALYLTAIIIASLPSFIRNRNNYSYRSLGASGGVSAIVFFTIYFFPFSKISIMFLPGIPAIVVGPLFLLYEAYMARTGKGKINHSAHFWGSAYGILFAFLIDPTHGRMFIEQLMGYRG